MQDRNTTTESASRMTQYGSTFLLKYQLEKRQIISFSFLIQFNVKYANVNNYSVKSKLLVLCAGDGSQNVPSSSFSAFFAGNGLEFFPSPALLTTFSDWANAENG